VTKKKKRLREKRNINSAKREGRNYERNDQ